MVVVFGGVEVHVEKGETAKLLIATPGRLVDLCHRGLVDLTEVGIVVIDEADKMTDMGIGPQIAELVKMIATVPQTVMCSATLPRRLKQLAAESFSASTSPSKLVVIGGNNKKDDLKIEDITRSFYDLEAAASGVSEAPKHANAEDVVIKENIEQVVQLCAAHKKPRKLLRFVLKIRKEERYRKRKTSPLLVFVNKINTVSFVAGYLRSHTSDTIDCIHGKLSQGERENVLRAFKAGRTTILVATDILGRGIHISDLPYVVNYDFPPNLLTYTHRIGRCAHQAENAKKGYAYSFFTRNLIVLGPDLIDLLKKAGQQIDHQLSKVVEDYQMGIMPVDADGEFSDPEE